MRKNLSGSQNIDLLKNHLFFRQEIYNRETYNHFRNDKPAMDSNQKYCKALERVLRRENIFFVSFWQLEISSVIKDARERIVGNSLRTQV